MQYCGFDKALRSTRIKAVTIQFFLKSRLMTDKSLAHFQLSVLIMVTRISNPNR